MGKEKKLLTIIIPIYNVEKYILDMLNSLLPQLNDSIECIFINDGSEDNSISILNNNIGDLSHIVSVLDKKNGGLSDARNYGLKYANGKYITFIDSDDSVSKNYIEIITEAINNINFDVLIFDATRIDETGKIISEIRMIPTAERGNVSREEVFKSGKWYAWSRVYNSELFRDVLFPVGKRYEDLITIPKLHKIASKCYYMNIPIINYRNNPNGITSNPSNDDISSLIDHANEVSKYVEKDFINLLEFISILKTIFILNYGTKNIFKSSIFYVSNTKKMRRRVGKKIIKYLSFKNQFFYKFPFFYHLYFFLRNR